MNILSKIACITFLSLPCTALAQSQGAVYMPDTAFKVIANGMEQAIAFGGGFNNPQLSMADLNNDGKQDLVVYERSVDEVRTFINKGTASNPDYRYAPEYAANFPIVNHYLKMLDYNCDNIPDLFHRGTMYGCEVYKGYYNAQNQLCFTYFKALFHPSPSGWVNVYCDPGDIPGIVDIDNDGDLDFLAFGILGYTLQWYRNMRVEDGLPCDSIRMILQDKCWGKIQQSFERTHLLGFWCAQNSPVVPDDPNGNQDTDVTSAGKTTLHTGNTLCFLDYDGDGDKDYLNGNILYPEIQFLKNGKVEVSNSRDTITSQDTTWQSNGHIYSTSLWPSAFHLDIDQDGDKDIVITPHGENVSENVRVMALYRNTGSDASPVFSYAGDSLITNKNIDVGTGSYPMLYDYDKDGKVDMFIGGDGVFQPNGNLRGKIAYYKNTSTTGNPSFTLQTNDFLNYFAVNTRGAYPAVGDLDNDGKDDLVIGRADGTLSFYKNNAASANTQPDWQLTVPAMTDAAGISIDSTQTPAPFIYDMDKDGKKDLIIGSAAGWLYYYKNVGNANELKLEHKTSKLGMVKADPQSLFGGYGAPFVGRIDNTSQDYLLMGSNSGVIYRFTGFQNGNTTAPYQRLDSAYSYIDTAFNDYSGYRSVPAVADLDNDGKYEMVVGNVLGGVKIYKQSIVVSVGNGPSLAEEKVIAYPNPAKESLNILWERDFSNGGNVVVDLYSMAGQKVAHVIVKNNYSCILPTKNLSAGVYHCVVTAGTSRKLLKVVIIN